MDKLAGIPGRSPEWFPFSTDLARDTVSFLRLREQDYSRASFLDQRILAATTALEVLPWQRLIPAIDAVPLVESCAFIFHIGHVGSTLLSRLMGAHPDVLSLREPLLLRTFAERRTAAAASTGSSPSSPLELRLGATLKLLSRTFRKRQGALVKATSFVSEIAVDLLSRLHAPKAIMMVVSPETYLATILGGPNSRQEARMMAPARLRRLHARLGLEAWRLDRFSEGQTLAMAWTCEVASLAMAANDRTLCVDFDAFLVDPASMLGAAFRHMGIPVAADDLRAILDGPIRRRYSKAPEFGYDTALRTEVLDSARAEHRGEILQGLEWLERAAADHVLVRKAVEFAKTAKS